MTDATASHGSSGLIDPKAAGRLRRRRRKETMLQVWGIAAIGFAAAALVALLWSVVFQARGALTETYISIPVTLTAEEIDPDGTDSPREILRGNFNTVVRDALAAELPGATGRTARRELGDLVSTGASFELARHVANERDLVGETISYDLLASDTVDLYLQGAYGGLNEVEVEGTLSAEIDDDTATVSSTAPDFATAFAEVRETLLDEAARVERQAGRVQRGVEVFQDRLDAAETEEDRARFADEVERRTASYDELAAQIADLRERADAEGGSEEIDRENVSVLLRAAGGWFKVTELSATSATAEVLTPPDGPVEAAPGDWRMYVSDQPEIARKVSDRQVVWVEELREAGGIKRVFNTRFFTAADSRDPELAGIWGAAVGSFWTMLVTFLLAFPVGVLTAIYLEEFAPKNRFTDFIEVNINNLAAVPSIVFGLLGLAVFLGFFGVPRSAPLAGGIVLALMTLPTIIIAGRAAIRAVPPSIRDAALGVGASKVQATFHHVLPLAMPGILTGTIIGMAQALGETAPLIMIGMVAFIVEVPTGILDSATVLPVQIYRWSDFPERAFEARTAAAICTLLAFLVVMNALAVFLRRRFERRW